MTTTPTDAQMKLAGRCATEAYKMAEDDRTTLHGYAVQSAMLAIQATEARAQGLVDASVALAMSAGKMNVALDSMEKFRHHREAVLRDMLALKQALSTWRRT